MAKYVKHSKDTDMEKRVSGSSRKDKIDLDLEPDQYRLVQSYCTGALAVLLTEGKAIPSKISDHKEFSSRSALCMTSEPKQECQAAILLLEVSVKTVLAKARG